jgi:hypothetical protein
MSKGIVVLLKFTFTSFIVVTLIKLTFNNKSIFSNELRLHPLVRWMSVRREVMLARMSSRASIVYIYTLMLQGTSSVKHIWSILWRLSIRMIEECFCHWNLRIITSSNSGRPNIEMGLNQFLLPVSSYREASAILLGRRLLEVILVESLIVGSWILGYIYITFMFNFKVIGF